MTIPISATANAATGITSKSQLTGTPNAIARPTSQAPMSWLLLVIPVAAFAVALIGIVIEPLLLRPFYRRAEEYQLLVTFGLLLILEDLVRLVWPGLPLTADTLMDTLPIIHI